MKIITEDPMSSGKRIVTNLWAQAALVAALGVIVALVAIVAPLSKNASAGDGVREISVPRVAVDQSQVDILSDGVVTRSEYDAAVNRTLACVLASGAEVVGLRYEDYRDRPVWNFAIKNPRTVSGDEVTPYDECWMRYERDVQTKWVNQNEPSASKKASNEGRAVACAQEENLGVDTASALSALVRSGASANRDGAIRCATIAFNGFDPVEHPPIRVE